MTTSIPEAVELIDFVETSLTVVSIRKDGIIEIRFKTEEYEVDVPDQLEIAAAFLKLNKDGEKSYHVLVLSGLYGGITKEAREMEMFESPAFKNLKSLSIVVHGLAPRLLGKLYFSLKKQKPTYPYRLFDSESAALKWIEQYNRG